MQWIYDSGLTEFICMQEFLLACAVIIVGITARAFKNSISHTNQVHCIYYKIGIFICNLLKILQAESNIFQTFFWMHITHSFIPMVSVGRILTQKTSRPRGANLTCIHILPFTSKAKGPFGSPTYRPFGNSPFGIPSAQAHSAEKWSLVRQCMSQA